MFLRSVALRCVALGGPLRRVASLCIPLRCFELFMKAATAHRVAGVQFDMSRKVEETQVIAREGDMAVTVGLKWTERSVRGLKRMYLT